RGGTHRAVAVADVVMPSTSSAMVETPDPSAVKMPCSSIVPLPAVTCQVGVTGTLLPHSSKAVAENATVSRGLRLAVAGRTRTVRGVPGFTVIFAVAASSPIVACTKYTPARSGAVKSPPWSIEASDVHAAVVPTTRFRASRTSDANWNCAVGAMTTSAAGTIAMVAGAPGTISLQAYA